MFTLKKYILVYAALLSFQNGCFYSAASADPGYSKTQEWTILNAQIKNQPANPDLWLKRANAFMSGFEDRKALNDCNEALRLNPNLVSAYFLRGDCYNHLGQFKLCEADYAQGLKLARKDKDVSHKKPILDALDRIAERFKSQRKFSDELKVREVIVQNTDYSREFMRLGRCELDLGRPSDALIHLRQSVAKRPGDGEAISLIGDCLAKQSNFEQAIDAYGEAIHILRKGDEQLLKRHHYQILKHRADSYMAIGQKNLAENDLQEYKKSEQTLFELIR